MEFLKTCNILQAKQWLITLFLCVFAASLHAQQKKKIYYDGSKQLQYTEQWNKKGTRAHFRYYFEDGKLKADGYKKKDPKYHREEQPDSMFVAYNPGGRVLQEMRMNADSMVVYTYDEDGHLRGKIWAGKNLSYENQYYLNGNLMMRHETTLPDSMDYFTSYYYPSKFARKNYPSAQRPQSLFPIHYGMAGNDGVSAPGTFKIYFFGSTRLAEPRGVCRASTYYPGGELMWEIADAFTYPNVKRMYARDGRDGIDSGQAYYPNGSVKELSYMAKDEGAWVHKAWHENGSMEQVSFCRYSPLNEDTAAGTEPLKPAINAANNEGATTVTFYDNGRLASVQAPVITTKYDSAGTLTEELLCDIGLGDMPDYSNCVNSTTLLHKGGWKDGMRDGEWTAYYGNDVNRLCYRVNYNNGLLNGRVAVYDSTGKLRLQYAVKDGYPDGRLLLLNGPDTVREGNYKNGLKAGEWRYYYRNGKLARVDSFNYTSEKLFACRLRTYHYDPWYLESEVIYQSETEYTEASHYPDGHKKSERDANGHVLAEYDEHGELKKK